MSRSQIIAALSLVLALFLVTICFWQQAQIHAWQRAYRAAAATATAWEPGLGTGPMNCGSPEEALWLWQEHWRTLSGYSNGPIGNFGARLQFH